MGENARKVIIWEKQLCQFPSSSFYFSKNTVKWGNSDQVTIRDLIELVNVFFTIFIVKKALTNFSNVVLNTY